MPINTGKEFSITRIPFFFESSLIKVYSKIENDIPMKSLRLLTNESWTYYE